MNLILRLLSCCLHLISHVIERQRLQVFTAWGLLSGLLFVLSMANTFLAIERLGLGSATGIWSGTAIIVSFTWGVKVQV